MELEQRVLHPFPDLEAFRSAVRKIGDDYFARYDLTVSWSTAAIMDAYSFWVAEVNRCGREIHSSKIIPETKVVGGLSVPSQLKKAGALTAVLNRVKPIRALSPKRLTYDHIPKSDFQTEVVEVYYNELLAFEIAKSIHLVADESREGMAQFSAFLKHAGLEIGDIFSHAMINDICFFLRSRAPSATSIYMMYRSIYATSYAWRKKNSPDRQT